MDDVLTIEKSYLRRNKKLPTVWCPGCGLGIIQGAIVAAIDAMGLSRDEVVFVSGIGCTGRMPTYLDFNTIHVTHGRALPAATGIKMANPSLKVFAVMGDGDAAAIGGNHLIHSARRNVDLVAIIVNNAIYGMTGGQYSPTTPLGKFAATAPYGQAEPPFDLCDLTAAAGAVYVARTTAFHTARITALVKRAIEKRGFSVVEVISNCHTTYGRRNKMASAVVMMKWMKENAVDIARWDKLSEQEKPDKIRVGVFRDIEKPEFLQNYQQLIERAQAAQRQADATVQARAAEPAGAVVPLPEPVSVRLSGTGGQGLLLAGVIYGKAVSVYDGRNAVQTQSYGPEARGGASKTDIILCDQMIDHPEAEELDLLLAMSQEACTKYLAHLKPEGMLITDALFVQDTAGRHTYPIHFTEIARNVIGRAVVANVVALGAMSVLSPLVSEAALRTAVLDAAPKGTAELNTRAFEEGIKAARELLEKRRA